VKPSLLGPRVLFLLLVCVGLLAACGKKGPPLPPLSRVPAPPANPQAGRFGDDVYVWFTVPSANVSGQSPADVSAIELYAVTSVIPPGGPDIRDAAERIVNWDYGRAGALQEMLAQFDFLVAPRHGEYIAPTPDAVDCDAAFQRLDLSGDYDPVSASAVRERIAQGLPWKHLVPPAVWHKVGEIYAITDRRC